MLKKLPFLPFFEKMKPVPKLWFSQNTEQNWTKFLKMKTVTTLIIKSLSSTSKETRWKKEPYSHLWHSKWHSEHTSGTLYIYLWHIVHYTSGTCITPLTHCAHLSYTHTTSLLCTPAVNYTHLFSMILLINMYLSGIIAFGLSIES